MIMNKIITKQTTIEILNNKIEQIALSPQIKQIILGGMLGDGCLNINKGYKNARYSFRHSMVQKEWFYWKADMLKKSDLTSRKYIFEQKPNGFSSHPKLRFQSKAHPLLTQLHNILCITNKKKFSLRG